MLVMCERWVGDGDRLPHTDPKFLCIIAALLPHSAGLLNRGPEGPSPLSGASSHYGILSQQRLELELWLQLKLNPACLEFQLTQTVCGTWLYNCLTPSCFLWASHVHRIQPVHRWRWYSDIFDQMYLFLDWRLGQRSISYRCTYVNKRKKIMWSNRKWALWNDICRCLQQLSHLEKARVRTSLQSVRVPRWGRRPPVERVGVSEGQVKASLQSLRVCPLGPVAHTRPPVEQPWPRSRRSAKWVLKITQRAMVKRRSYGLIWQSVLSSPVRLSHKPQKLQLLSKE